MWRIFQMCVFISLSPFLQKWCLLSSEKIQIEKWEEKNSANTFKRGIGLTSIGNGMTIKQSRAMLYRSQGFLAPLPFAIAVITYTGSTAAPGREMGHLQGGFQHLVEVYFLEFISLFVQMSPIADGCEEASNQLHQSSPTTTRSLLIFVPCLEFGRLLQPLFHLSLSVAETSLMSVWFHISTLTKTVTLLILSPGLN